MTKNSIVIFDVKVPLPIAVLVAFVFGFCFVVSVAVAAVSVRQRPISQHLDSPNRTIPSATFVEPPSRWIDQETSLGPRYW